MWCDSNAAQPGEALCYSLLLPPSLGPRASPSRHTFAAAPPPHEQLPAQHRRRRLHRRHRPKLRHSSHSPLQHPHPHRHHSPLCFQRKRRGVRHCCQSQQGREELRSHIRQDQAHSWPPTGCEAQRGHALVQTGAGGPLRREEGSSPRATLSRPSQSHGMLPAGLEQTWEQGRDPSSTSATVPSKTGLLW